MRGPLISNVLIIYCLAYCLAAVLSLAPLAAEARPLHIGNAGEPQTLDPHRYNLRLEETLLNDLFMGLTTFNARGEIVPGAARSWSSSADGLTWTFELRDDLKWSDGTPLDAHDFVFAYRRLQAPATAASLAYFMHMLKNAASVNRGDLPPEALGVSAPGDLTLVLELERPYPYLLERLLYPTAYPVPQHAIEQHGDAWVKAANWVSNGAYVLAEWQPQSHVELAANPHFIEQPRIQSVTYHAVPNEQTAYNQYRSGALDAIAAFPVGELEKVKQDNAAELRLSGLLSMMYLVFNTEVAPFDDVRVRQALSLAIDQRILTDKVLRSGNTPAFSFTPALLDGYRGVPLPHADMPTPARLDQARSLLAAAGFDAARPLELTLRHVTGGEQKKVNLAITGMWRRLGVRAQLHQSELRNHFGDLRQGDFEVAWAGWVGENNAEHYLSLLQSDTGDVNYGRFKNAAYDALMQRAQNTADVTARNALLQKAEALAVEQYAVVPLYSTAVRRLVHPELAGWYDNPRDIHQARYLYWAPSL